MNEPNRFICDDPEGYAGDDDDGSCFMCGGSGYREDQCECETVESVCCCRVPTPPVCDECGGAG
jgi:hypothetical protein